MREYEHFYISFPEGTDSLDLVEKLKASLPEAQFNYLNSIQNIIVKYKTSDYDSAAAEKLLSAVLLDYFGLNIRKAEEKRSIPERGGLDEITETN